MLQFSTFFVTVAAVLTASLSLQLVARKPVKVPTKT